MNKLIQHLLAAPAEQLHYRAKPMIEHWSDPPKLSQVVEVLDNCAKHNLAGKLARQLLETLMFQAMGREGIDEAELLNLYPEMGKIRAIKQVAALKREPQEVVVNGQLRRGRTVIKPCPKCYVCAETNEDCENSDCPFSAKG